MKRPLRAATGSVVLRPLCSVTGISAERSLPWLARNASAGSAAVVLAYASSSSLFVVRAVRRAIPMDDRHQQQLLDKFSTVVRATVKGNLVVATIQGALGGVAFWWLGATSALLWGTAMAFVSLLPAVGAALIWAPFAIYLVLSGSVWQGIALVAYGVLVIGLVDNLLRPVLVGKDTQMPDYMVMITTLGGMAVFGINGFVIGPTIAAMFIAAWHLYASSRAEPPP